MQTTAFRRHALLPKPELAACEAADYHESIATGLGRLAPAERRALAAIVESADLIEVPGAPQHLLVEVTPEVIDALAQFGAELEELEPPEDDEDTDQDDDRDNDNAFDRVVFNTASGFFEPDVGDVEWEEGVPPKGARKTARAFAAAYRRRSRGRPSWKWPSAAAVVKALLGRLKRPGRDCRRAGDLWRRGSKP